MCGLFAWLAPSRAAWNGELATAAVTGAAARGPHGWGVAQWLDPEVRRHGIFVTRMLGPIMEGPAELAWEPKPGILVGHCRLATSGGPGGYDDEASLQPLMCDRLAVAHNGVVRNADQLVRDYPLYPRTDNDSEVAGLLLAWALRGASNVLVEAAAALRLISPTSPQALLALLPDGRILAASRGLPLHRAVHGPGYYLSSRPMPDSCPMPRDSAMLLAWEDERADWKAVPL